MFGFLISALMRPQHVPYNAAAHRARAAEQRKRAMNPAVRSWLDSIHQSASAMEADEVLPMLYKAEIQLEQKWQQLNAYCQGGGQKPSYDQFDLTEASGELATLREAALREQAEEQAIKQTSRAATVLAESGCNLDSLDDCVRVLLENGIRASSVATELDAIINEARKMRNRARFGY